MPIKSVHRRHRSIANDAEHVVRPPAEDGLVRLHRLMGNRATQQLLQRTPALLPLITRHAAAAAVQRYKIEGPWHKNDPVHEVLTLQAIKEAISRIKHEDQHADQKTQGPLGLLNVKMNARKDAAPMTSTQGHNIFPEYTSRSVHQFLRGVVWADDPAGLLFDEPQDMTNYSSGISWYNRYSGKNTGDLGDLTARSHYGDLQFMHSMANADNEDPAVTKKRIMDWSNVLVRIASGEIAHTMQAGKVQELAWLFPEHRDLTIAALLGYPKGTAQDIRQRAAGVLMHMVQDSNAEGHTAREGDTGSITQFRAYAGQDEHKHGEKDKWAEGHTLGERLRNTPGTKNAIKQCTQLLVMIESGAPTEQVLQYLDEQIFRLSENAQRSGPGEGYGHAH
jgi:hypothetical protein